MLVCKKRVTAFIWSKHEKRTLGLVLISPPFYQDQSDESRIYHIYQSDESNILLSQQIRDSIVVSIPACQLMQLAGDRGSIPRHGVLIFFLF